MADAPPQLVSILLHAQDLWILTIESSPNICFGTFVVNPKEFPSNDIKAFWNQSANISYVSWSNGSWVVVAKGWTDDKNRPIQGIALQDEFPRDKITEAWKQGWNISSMCFGDGVWVYVKEKPAQADKASPLQKLVVTSKFPDKEIQDAWNNNHFVRVLAAGNNGEWVLITQSDSYGSGSEPHPVQSFYAQSGAFPEEKVKEKLKDGWAIAHITFEQKESIWAIIFEKAQPGHTQKLFVTKSYPDDIISQYMK